MSSVEYSHSSYSTDPAWTIRRLLPWIVENLLSVDNPEMLITADGNVRPGILVLVNETDWALRGQLDYRLQPHDVITFISTLHGG